MECLLCGGKSMRIAIYIGELQEQHIGGGYSFQQGIISEIVKLNTGHKFYIYYMSSEKLFEDNINCTFKNIPYYVDRQSRINNLLSEDKIDLIYLLPPYTFFINISIPNILTIWDLAHKIHPYFPEVSINKEYENREQILNAFIKQATYIIIGNEEGKRQIITFYNIYHNRIKTIPMPVTSLYIKNVKENSSIITKYNLKNKGYLFYPAQFWAHKNHIRLVKAMLILKNQGSHLKLVLTGSDKGNMQYIQQKIKEMDLASTILILGFVSQEEIITLYKNAYALVYPSFFGPDNLPPLEAMSLNCPVICANTEGMQEQLGNYALYFNPLSEYDIVDKVNFLNNLKLRLTLTNGGNLLAKKCTIQAYLQQLIEVINTYSSIRECWE